MMKTCLIIAMVATVGLAAAAPSGEKADLHRGLTEGHERRHGKFERGGEQNPAAPKLGKLVESMDLSAEKETQVREILEAHRGAMAEWHREHQERSRRLRKHIHEAAQAANHKAATAAKEQMKKLAQARDELNQQTIKRLSDRLSGEQLAKVKKLLALSPRKGKVGRDDRLMRALKKLSLTKEQNIKVRRIVARARLQAMRRALGEIRTEVLTPQQREKLDSQEILKSLRAGRRGGQRREGRKLRGRDRRGPEEIEGAYRSMMERGRPGRRSLAPPMARPQQRELTGAKRGPRDLAGLHRGSMERGHPGGRLLAASRTPRKAAKPGRRGPRNRCPCCGREWPMSPEGTPPH